MLAGSAEPVPAAFNQSSAISPNGQPLELQQRPQAQVEQRKGGTFWRANHRHPGSVISKGFIVFDSHVLGPLRPDKQSAAVDLQKFKLAYQREGQNGLFAALREVSSCELDNAARMQIREWSVQVEMGPTGDRWARAAIVIRNDSSVPVSCFGRWRLSRKIAEDDIERICDAFADGGIAHARRCPAAEQTHVVEELDTVGKVLAFVCFSGPAAEGLLKLLGCRPEFHLGVVGAMPADGYDVMVNLVKVNGNSLTPVQRGLAMLFGKTCRELCGLEPTLECNAGSSVMAGSGAMADISDDLGGVDASPAGSSGLAGLGVSGLAGGSSMAGSGTMADVSGELGGIDASLAGSSVMAGFNSSGDLTGSGLAGLGVSGLAGGGSSSLIGNGPFSDGPGYGSIDMGSSSQGSDRTVIEIEDDSQQASAKRPRITTLPLWESESQLP